MEIIKLEVQKRDQIGKKATKAVRNQGLIPCILYNSKENLTFSVHPNDVKRLVYTGDFRLADIEIDGKNHRCILKDLSFHPVTDNILHIDFLELEDGRHVKVQIPIRFEGTSPGVKVGGKLQQLLRTVEVKTTPEHLVSELKVDISALRLGESLKVRDIQITDDMEIMNSTSIPIVSVITPRALKSKEAKEEALAAQE